MTQMKTSGHDFRIANGGDKRSVQRFVTLSPIEVSLIRPAEQGIEIIKVMDISLDGISIMTSRPLPLGLGLSLAFESPSYTAYKVESEATAIRCLPTGGHADEIQRFICGLSLKMSAEKKKQWGTFIKEILHNGAAVADRRKLDRYRNALVLKNPAKHQSYKTSRDTALVQVQQLSMKDLDELEVTETKAWGKEMCATREMLKSRLEVFPEGVIGARINKKLVGYVAVMKIKSDILKKDFTWWGITDGGFIRATHDSDGDCLYGVSLSVIPSAPKNVAVILLKSAGKLSVRKALKGIYFGARMPNYHKYKDTYTPDQYVSATSKKGRILDVELALYRQMNAIPVRVIPNYFDDPASLNYGVLVSFVNPFYEIQTGEYPFFINKVTVDFT